MLNSIGGGTGRLLDAAMRKLEIAFVEDLPPA
jgi:hypothetical protein